MTVEKAELLLPHLSDLLPETVKDICETLFKEIVRRGEVNNQYHNDRVKMRDRAEAAEAKVKELQTQLDHDSLTTLDYGVCKASLAQARAQRDAFRVALERILDDADCTDLEECKHVAREALER